MQISNSHEVQQEGYHDSTSRGGKGLYFNQDDAAYANVSRPSTKYQINTVGVYLWGNFLNLKNHV